MERMTCNLHHYLTQPENKNCPVCEKASILHDVSNGLNYLHSQTPAIIHRDLTATNILLDRNRRAKIADFGNARIVDMNPLATPRTMTANPGTINYMPPEVHDCSSETTDKLDMFSFGHLSLFVIIQELINPLVATYVKSGSRKLLARSEVERREEYIKKAEQILGEKHVLIVMMKKCLDLDTAKRPSAKELCIVLNKFLDSVPEKKISE